MKVYFEDTGCFGDKAAWDPLSTLFRRAALGQHVLVFKEGEGAKAAPFLDQMAPPRYRQEWEELVSRTVDAGDADADSRAADPGTRPPTRHAEITQQRSNHPMARWSLRPTDAGDWAERPLRVLLENENDRHLIAASVRLFQRDKVATAIVGKWLVFEQRGGVTEVGHAVKRLSPQERALAFVDSDRATPDGEPHRNSKGVEKTCKAKKVPCHLTQRRAMENYLPPDWLVARVVRMPPSHMRENYLRRSRSWRNLAAEVRHHEDLPGYLSEAKKRTRAFDKAKKYLRGAIRELDDGPHRLENVSEWDESAQKELLEVLELIEEWL